MKRASTVFGIAILIAGAAGAASAAESAGGLAPGAKLPAAVAKTKMKNVDGKMLSIADVTGKSGTLVIFTCNHCPFARDWEQRIVELGNTYAGKGIGVMLVNANDPAANAEDGFDEMQARAKSRGMKIPYVVDDTSGVARAFGASVTPEAFLFDRSGKLVYHGTIDDNRREPDKVKARYLKDALDAVVAGKAPAVPETKGLGCGIKFRG
jgi:thiol-disulfide isomerase/thioredoxin